MRVCVERNAELSVTGLELQPEVAEQARRNLRSWGADARATVETGDVRTYAFREPFDVVTMHNNIYYFAETEQVAVLRHVRSLLRPDGRLLLTTACRGGSASVMVLSLWGAMTAGCSRVATPEELTARIDDAGFVEVTARNLAAPVDAFYAFTGRVPAG
jgi:SAM-dependent methyltransferase